MDHLLGSHGGAFSYYSFDIVIAGRLLTDEPFIDLKHDWRL